MSYPFLRSGDRIPAVGVAQKLLNARAGSSLVADGDFGSRTATATRDFQRPRALAVDGVIGQITWGRLKQMTDNLDIVDCVDVFDPSLNNLEAADITRAGGSPILIGGMSNGVEQAVTNIISSVRPGKVFILRFHGHGAQGVAGVSDGHGDIPGEHFSSIQLSNWAYMEPIITRLRPIFGPYGCIQFMHCETGGGADGLRMLQNVANATGVPATGGIHTQFGGGLRTFRFEGPTRTAFPAGGNLRSWSAARPEFAGMTVP
jgi:Putative peptidoglycan binding domain